MPIEKELKDLTVHDITGKEGGVLRTGPHLSLTKVNLMKWCKKEGKQSRITLPLKCWKGGVSTFINQNVLLKILKATTQLAAIEPPDSTQTIRQHEQRRLYAFRFRRINDILCIDNFEWEKKFR